MPQSTLIPCLRYRDAPAAIDFLCGAFGFTRHAVYADDADPSIVHHAQLVFGNSMVMLGSARPGEMQALYGWKTPAEAGGITMCVCAWVAASPSAILPSRSTITTPFAWRLLMVKLLIAYPPDPGSCESQM